MITEIAVSTTAALGAYNMVSFLARRAAERRRQIRAIRRIVKIVKDPAQRRAKAKEFIASLKEDDE